MIGKEARKAVAISAGVAGAAYFVYKVLKAWTVQRFKTAKGWPILGIFPEIDAGKKLVRVLERLADEIGDEGVYEISMLGERQVVVCSFEEMKKVMEPRPSKVRRFICFEKFKDIFNGVFIAEGQDWKRQRRLTAPAFHPKAMHDYVPFIADVVRQFGQQAEDVCCGGDGNVNYTPLIKQTTSAILIKTLTGSDEFSSDFLPNMVAQMDIIFAVLQHRFFLPPYWRIPILGDMLPTTREAKKYIKMTEDLIGKNAQDKSLLSKLIEAKDGDKLSPHELIGNVITLFTAGTDTTGTTVVWALYELSKRPDLQERIAAEALAVAPDGAQTLAQVERMKLVRAVWKETLRLETPVPLIAFTLLADLELAGRVVPRDSMVYAMLRWAYNHSPDVKKVLGDDLDVWNPERWFDSNGDVREIPPFDNLPFGYGSRNCLGKPVSDIEGVLLISEVCRRLEMEPCAFVPEEILISTAAPDRDLILKCKKRVMK